MSKEKNELMQKLNLQNQDKFCWRPGELRKKEPVEKEMTAEPDKTSNHDK